MEKLIKLLQEDYRDIDFVLGDQFCWSPKNRQITFTSDKANASSVWALLHELSHAICEHHTYATDIELLYMEVEAWNHAKALATHYGYMIDETHIQDCLDTYRDWLDQRSTCPLCGNNSLQSSPEEYRCFNCQTTWQVSNSRFCRPYRQTNRRKKQTSPGHVTQTTFS